VADSLGDRMKKNYESVSRHYLTRRMPVIGRVDGKAFHQLTRGMERPWDLDFMRCMQLTALNLCKDIQGCKLAYVQSDEISLLLTDYDDLQTEAWFANNLQKMASIAAAIATVHFNRKFHFYFPDKQLLDPVFDARFFSVPKEEVCNYFIWRQQDATRNSISMLAQANFPHKELQGLSSSQLQDKLMLEKDINWDNCLTSCKRGTCVTRAETIISQTDDWKIDLQTPIFTEDRNYVERWV
jgi:tRNA(His) 5'-end guanylyltransferase